MSSREHSSAPSLPDAVKLGTRDLASDWRSWSWAERVAAIATVLLLAGAPLLVSAAISSS